MNARADRTLSESQKDRMDDIATNGATEEELAVLQRLERCGELMLLSARLMDQDEDCIEKTRRAIESSTAKIRESDAHIDRLRPWQRVAPDEAAPPPGANRPFDNRYLRISLTDGASACPDDRPLD